jgi:hypothetical protein
MLRKIFTANKKTEKIAYRAASRFVLFIRYCVISRTRWAGYLSAGGDDTIKILAGKT